MRRIVDIAVALLILGILSPLLAVVAAIIVASSPGNPLYGGWRAGLHGRKFRMWKFRTMVKDAARFGPITGRDDPRVTPVGRLLRRTKLDELPQFINLLMGDMTLVGPRPESPEIVELYDARQRAVLDVKPGITGRVQIQSPDESETIPEGVDSHQYYVRNMMEPKLQMDLDYLAVRSPASDAQIVLATAGLVLRAFLRG
jgi:lipopolysaccharide/colanic/teichoic acid biosynthesis glycosyltransferase